MSTLTEKLVNALDKALAEPAPKPGTLLGRAVETPEQRAVRERIEGRPPPVPKKERKPMTETEAARDVLEHGVRLDPEGNSRKTLPRPRDWLQVVRHVGQVVSEDPKMKTVVGRVRDLQKRAANIRDEMNRIALKREGQIAADALELRGEAIATGQQTDGLPPILNIEEARAWREFELDAHKKAVAALGREAWPDIKVLHQKGCDVATSLLNAELQNELDRPRKFGLAFDIENPPPLLRSLHAAVDLLFRQLAAQPPAGPYGPDPQTLLRPDYITLES